jgi:hypothetical protein
MIVKRIDIRDWVLFFLGDHTGVSIGLVGVPHNKATLGPTPDVDFMRVLPALRFRFAFAPKHRFSAGASVRLVSHDGLDFPSD